MSSSKALILNCNGAATYWQTRDWFYWWAPIARFWRFLFLLYQGRISRLTNFKGLVKLEFKTYTRSWAVTVGLANANANAMKIWVRRWVMSVNFLKYLPWPGMIAAVVSFFQHCYLQRCEHCVCVLIIRFLTSWVRTFLGHKDILAGPHNFII